MKLKLIKTTIRITAKDIAFGIPHRPDRCAVALAIARCIKPHYVVSCGLPSLTIFSNGIDTWQDLTALEGVPADTIRAFDAGRAKPISFTLNLPQRFLRK